MYTHITVRCFINESKTLRKTSIIRREFTSWSNKTILRIVQKLKGMKYLFCTSFKLVTISYMMKPNKFISCNVNKMDKTPTVLAIIITVTVINFLLFVWIFRQRDGGLESNRRWRFVQLEALQLDVLASQS